MTDKCKYDKEPRVKIRLITFKSAIYLKGRGKKVEKSLDQTFKAKGRLK